MVGKICVLIDKFVEWIIILLFCLMVAAGGMQVFNRFILNKSLSWSEEFQRYAHIWIVYLAIPAAYRRGMHLGMTVLKEKMPKTAQKGLALLVHVLWIALAASIILFSRRILQVSARQTSPGMGLPMNVVYLGMVIGSIYLLFVAVRKLLEELWPALALGGTESVDEGEAAL